LTQQYEFEGVIADYAHKIDSFSEKSRRLEDENKELRTEVESLSSRSRKAEDALSKRNEEYCTLYNYLFTEKRGTLQDAFLKEIDLSNRLNEIQHESDTQIISKLKNTIKNKN
jgi:metal-responsive CopG/Arc/MetJ family transcriptional regulator